MASIKRLSKAKTAKMFKKAVANIKPSNKPSKITLKRGGPMKG